MSYFGSDIHKIVIKYNNLKTSKALGIITNASDIALLEIEAYGIIESELQKVSEYKMQKESKKSGKGKR